MRAIAFTVLVLASACGAPRAATPSSTPSPAPTAPSSERLVVEAAGETAILDAGSGRLVASLPDGTLSPARDLVVRVVSDPAKTAVSAFGLDGRARFGIPLAGQYGAPGAYGPSPSGFSPNGRWLVLVERRPAESRFAVIDLAQARLAKIVTLSARFTFDAIHNDGTAMYLIEHPDPGTTKYNVRFYDLAAGVLKPDIIFDKTAIAAFDPTTGLMDGTFHVSVAPTSGDWSYGLYMRPNGAPFVHALNVPGHYAHCIVNVAGKWSASSMFSMALTADGRELYVVDTVGGSATAIDGVRQKVARTASFATKGGPGDAAAASAVLSPDGSRLYASAPRGIAMLQTTDLTLRAWLAPDLAARALAVSSDGVRLYALAGGEVVVIDARSGQTLGRYAAPDGARSLRLLPREAAASR